jgi:hypothetical protein
MGEGKTVERAIEDALNKLQVSLDEVNVEVVQEPTSGVLGWKSSPAVVRVTHKERISTAPGQLGAVSVSGGQLQLDVASSGGIPARLRFGSELHVVYNGEVREGKVDLTDGLENLEIILPENREPELHYEIKVNADRTKAELFWKRTPGVIYELADHPPTNQLHLSLRKDLVEPPALTVADVREIAQIQGLQFGLKLDELSAEILQAGQGLFTIAEGKAPEPPQPASITYVFQEDAPEIDPDAIRIDHYEVHGIRGVEPGAVLAVKTPGAPGVPGTDVYGDALPVAPLKDVDILVGEGAVLSADGLQALATVAGLPTLQSGVIRVTSVFELDGNADVSTGNITMDGAIIIKGNVLENVKVESTNGNIVVNGLVSGAILRTGGSITVLKNAIRSQLFAGGATVAQVRLLSMLHKIGHQLDGLIRAYESIVAQAENIPFENLIKHLLELKFFNLPKEIKEFADYVEQIGDECSVELLELKASLVASLCGLGPLQISDIDILKRLLAFLRAQELKLESQADIEADASVGYLQNSKIEASRNVAITGQGCFYSTILAGKEFKIPNGVVRGGEVIVNEGNIIAKEFGGPTGISTTARIVKNGRITANLVHPNVGVAIGEQSYRFSETTSMVKVFLQGGILTVYSGSNKIHG